MKAMNRKKLSRLVVDKQQELEMTQEQFAEWFSEIASNKVSYGFIQALSDTRKTSIPEWVNMKGIAKMWNLTLDELDLYLENDEITDVKEISSVYQELAGKTIDEKMIFDVITTSLPIKAWIAISTKLIEKAFSSVESKLQQASALLDLFDKAKDLRNN